MNNVIKNVLLLVVILVLSYFTAEYFGSWYDKFAPLRDRSLLGLSKGDLISLVGIPFAYIFFTILLFKLFGSGNINKWTGWLLVPPALFFAAGDLKHIYLPIIIGLIGWGIALLSQKVLNFRKDRP